MLTRLLIPLLCTILCVSPALAGGNDNSTYGASKSRGLNDSTTGGLVRALERANRQCAALDTVYRYDCYRQTYRSAADRLEGNAAYAVPLAALREVEQTLGTIVARNADPAAPAIRKRGATFQPVTPASTAKAKETFRRSLDKASTVLLRSPGNNGDHFARIAQALDSDKVLLRALIRSGAMDLLA